MKYPDGKDVTLRDLIWYNEGVNIYMVTLILDTKEKWLACGLDEPGFMVSFDVSGKIFGKHLFVSLEEFEREGIGLLNEQELTEMWQHHESICAQDPTVKGHTFSVTQEIWRGYPWIFQFSIEAPDSVYYVVLANGEIKPLSKEDAPGNLPMPRTEPD